MSDNKIELSGIFSEGYGIIPKKLMRMNIDIKMKAILAYMLSYTGNGDTCFPGIRTMATDLKISHTTVVKYLKQAVEMKMVVKSKLNNDPMNHANKYKLVFLEHDVPDYNNIDVPASGTPDVPTGGTSMGQPVEQNNNTINNNTIIKTTKNPAKRRAPPQKDPRYKFGKDENGKPTLCQCIEDSFTAVQKWESSSYGRERKEVRRIADYAYHAAPDDPASYCGRLLHCILKIKKDPRHWLKDTPFTPSGLSYKVYLRVKEAMGETKLPDIEEPEDKETAAALNWYFQGKKLND